MTTKINFYKLLCLITLVGVIFYSCSVEDDSNETKSSFKSLKDMIIIKESSNLLTKQFASLGVTRVNISKKNDFFHRLSGEVIEYSFDEAKPFYVDNQLVDISNFKFILSDDNFILDNNTSYYLSVENGIFYLNSPSNKINLMNDNQQYQFDVESSLLLLAFNELTSFDSRIPAENEVQSYPAPCNFWNKYEVISLGFTSYESKMNSYNATRGINALGAGCRSMGPPTTSCLFDNHICATTRSFCCD